MHPPTGRLPSVLCAFSLLNVCVCVCVCVLNVISHHAVLTVYTFNLVEMFFFDSHVFTSFLRDMDHDFPRVFERLCHVSMRVIYS